MYLRVLVMGRQILSIPSKQAVSKKPMNQGARQVADIPTDWSEDLRTFKIDQ